MLVSPPARPRCKPMPSTFSATQAITQLACLSCLALPSDGGPRQGRDDGCIWALGHRCYRLARYPRNASARVYHGGGGANGAYSKCGLLCAAVGIPSRRLQHALCMDLHAKRCEGNLAVLLAALGVFGTGSGWPDLVVASIMAALALQGAGIVLRQALVELHQSPAGSLGRQLSLQLRTLNSRCHHD